MISFKDFCDKKYGFLDWRFDEEDTNQPTLYIESSTNTDSMDIFKNATTTILDGNDYYKIVGISILEWLHSILPKNSLIEELKNDHWEDCTYRDGTLADKRDLLLQGRYLLSKRECKTFHGLQNLYNNLSRYYLKNNVPTIIFRRTNLSAVVPTRRVIDAGYDLTIISLEKQLTRNTFMYNTGICLQIPMGYYVEVFGRSSISKLGYAMANSVAIIDNPYIGEVKLLLTKTDPTMPDLVLPCRIAQFILKPFTNSYLVETQKKLTNTTRGGQGIGSTDKILKK